MPALKSDNTDTPLYQVDCDIPLPAVDVARMYHCLSPARIINDTNLKAVEFLKQIDKVSIDFTVTKFPAGFSTRSSCNESTNDGCHLIKRYSGYCVL